jgi:hypothetical protein
VAFDELIQFRNLVLMGSRKVIGFSQVTFEIVQLEGMRTVFPFMKKPDQFPITRMN